MRPPHIPYLFPKPSHRSIMLNSRTASALLISFQKILRAPALQVCHDFCNPPFVTAFPPSEISRTNPRTLKAVSRNVFFSCLFFLSVPPERYQQFILSSSTSFRFRFITLRYHYISSRLRSFHS